MSRSWQLLMGERATSVDLHAPHATFPYRFAGLHLQGDCAPAWRGATASVRFPYGLSGFARAPFGSGRSGVGHLHGRSPTHRRLAWGGERASTGRKSNLGTGGAAGGSALAIASRSARDCQVPLRGSCLSPRDSAAGPEWRLAPEVHSLALGRSLEQLPVCLFAHFERHVARSKRGFTCSPVREKPHERSVAHHSGTPLAHLRGLPRRLRGLFHSQRGFPRSRDARAAAWSHGTESQTESQPAGGRRHRRWVWLPLLEPWALRSEDARALCRQDGAERRADRQSAAAATATGASP